MDEMTALIPGHIPPEVVVDFDYLHPDGVEDVGVYRAWDRLHQGPDIVWTPRYGGHWILTRAEDIRWVQSSYDLFSHKVMSVPKSPEPFVMPPISEDPPNHARYRSLLNPAFAKRAVGGMADMARQLTVELAEAMRPRGECEFVSEFSRTMPVSVFLTMVDLPIEMREQFVEWAVAYMAGHKAGQSHAERAAVIGKIIGYLASVVAERAKQPGDDLISKIIQAGKTDRFENEQQVIGMLLVLFLGGLDTVANLLSFATAHLAEHPEHRRLLIEDPAIIPAAVEEYLRRHGLSNTTRLITRDFEHKGLRFKAGELIMVPINLSSTDDRAYENPFEVDFDRPNRELHNTFGNGPHRCPGAVLARAELAIFFEEFLPRVPNFRIKPGGRVKTSSGLVVNVGYLPLVWDV